MIDTLRIPYGDREIIIETGKVAKQARGAVTVQLGDTVVLVAVVSSDQPVEDLDFFPLMVDYRERYYAAGRVPGTFFRREGRPQEHEILQARLVDRSIRPLFPDGCRYEVQVYVTVLSADSDNLPDTLGIIGASVALNMSEIPFQSQVAAVKVAMEQGEPILNPTDEQLKQSSIDLIIAGNRDGVLMIEGDAQDIDEKYVLASIKRAQEEITRMIDQMDAFCEKYRKEKFPMEPREIPEELVEQVTAEADPIISQMLVTEDKKLRQKIEKEGLEAIQLKLVETFPEEESTVASLFADLYKKRMRAMILEEGRRIDGRGYTDIREIESAVQVLPRTHGSALFTRGQTQALSTVTLGTPEDAQTVDDLLGVTTRRFMLHYNFPSFSVGEVRPVRGPGRREIGHGALAERALLHTIPPKEEFPYTIRIVSEILESNGSSSMATVCAGCLSLMDAGVPVTNPVSGIALGMVKEGDKAVIISDIIGQEDHYGDMDLKIAGTRTGVTAIQMDLKVPGIDFELLERAFHQARDARNYILDKMLAVLDQPRADLSPYAPRIHIMQIPREKIGELIGPGGKIIRGIIEETGVKIDVEDDGTVYIASVDGESAAKAIQMVENITADVELNKDYIGKVVRLVDFGALVEVLPGKVGLLHISEMENHRVAKVEDVCKEGDEVKVRVIGIDRDSGKIRLSRRVLLEGGGESRREEYDRKGSRDRRGSHDRRSGRGSKQRS